MLCVVCLGALVISGAASAVPVGISEVRQESGWDDTSTVCGFQLRGDWYEPDGDLPHGRMLWKVAGRPLSVVPINSVSVGKATQMPVGHAGRLPTGQGSRLLRLPAGRILEREGGVVLVDADGEWELTSDQAGPELLWSRQSDGGMMQRRWSRVGFAESASRKLEDGELVPVDEAAPGPRPDLEPQPPPGWRAVLKRFLQAVGVRFRQKAADWKESLQVSAAWHPVEESRPSTGPSMARRMAG